MSYAAAAQNQLFEEEFRRVPREVAPVVDSSSNLGAGATPADGTNRSAPLCSCCPPPSRGGFCSAPQAVWGRTAASPSLSLQSGCESRALPCSRSIAESDRRAWAQYYDLWRRISRLEVETLHAAEPAELRVLRAEQTALIGQVDRHLENCRGPHALG